MNSNQPASCPFCYGMFSTCKLSNAQMEALQRNKGQLLHTNHVEAVPVYEGMKILFSVSSHRVQ